jgi:hypothetical protein
MHTETPTRREIWLAVFLLVSLLFLSRSSHSSYVLPASIQTGLQGNLSAPNASLAGDEIVLHSLRDRIRWGKAQVPETKIVAHVPGWTIFDKLYMLNGTLYIVTDEPSKIPDRSVMTSIGVPIEPGAVEQAKRVPTDKELQIISPRQAKVFFGPDAELIDGVSWLANDAHQFVTHYYHWSAELFFGLWRTYSSLDPSINSTGNTILPPPRRMIFSHLPEDRWRDYASMNQWVLRSSFPSIALEFSGDWAERAEMGRLFVFDRVVLADRAAAMFGFNFQRTQRTASEPFALPGSVNWWSTIRSNVIQAAGLRGNTGEGTTSNPVITYISRQGWGRRMLVKEDHEKLVRELYKLRDNYGYEVNVVSMDKLSRQEQFRLAARTTIMMGVHGNGLTSLVWMKPSPRSTVMEFFYPGGFAHDYEWTSRALGMVHYGFWNDRAFTSPDVPPVNYPPGFQGNEIPIDGEAVARLCLERLTLSEEADD